MVLFIFSLVLFKLDNWNKAFILCAIRFFLTGLLSYGKHPQSGKYKILIVGSKKDIRFFNLNAFSSFSERYNIASEFLRFTISRRTFDSAPLGQLPIFSSKGLFFKFCYSYFRRRFYSINIRVCFFYSC